MRLGVVMTGMGAHAAANTGVLRALSRRGMEPFAVCGMLGGAWPAALFASGRTGGADMEKAIRQTAACGRRLIASSVWARRGGAYPMASGARLNHLLNAQTGQRLLSLCPGAALFPCRLARSGQRVLFSTRAFVPEAGALLHTQASAAFAARAAMALPPFLAPMGFMGSPLLPETDVAFAVRQLQLMGAQRVLVVLPCLSPRHAADALDLAGAALGMAPPLSAHAGVLRIEMPDEVGALSLEKLALCCEAGERTACAELDQTLERMGLPLCRVLPFRRRSV